MILHFIKENFIWLFIITILAGGNGFLFNSFSNKDRELIRVNGELYELLSHKIDTVYVENIITEYRDGRTIYVDVEVPIEIKIPIDVDTLSILRDYYATRIYKDTLNVTADDLTPLGWVAVTDTISENRIVGRYFSANILQRTIIDEKIVKELPKTQLWAGFTTSTNMQIGGSFSLITRNKNHIGIDLGVYEDDGLTPYVGVRYLWQIR
jgi:hypothetical protein